MDRVRRARAENGTAVLVLDCLDAWGWLERQTAPTTTLHKGKTIRAIIKRLAATVAAQWATPADSRLDRIVNALSVDVGGKYAEPLVRLLKEGGYCLRFATAQANAGGPSSLTAVVFDPWPWPLPADALLVGPTQYRPLALEREEAPLAPNHVVVWGTAMFNHAYDLDHIHQHAYQLTERWTARHLTTDAATQDAADRLLLWHTERRRLTNLTLPLHPCVQVGDSAALSDPWLGLVDEPAQVWALRTRYNPGRGLATTTLSLGGAD